MIIINESKFNVYLLNEFFLNFIKIKNANRIILNTLRFKD